MPVIRFGEFELDEQTLELRRNGNPKRIQQQPARVLAFLLKHRGSLVTREQIRLAIWGDSTFVDFEQGLNFCIRQIRIALGDKADHPRYVETLPRLGYRLVAAVEMEEGTPPYAKKSHIRIAVVPFVDLASQPEDYFVVGLTEDMVSALSRIDPSRLRVTTVGKLAADATAEDLSQLQRHFGLDYVLRGLVRRSADKVRIVAQLHDLRDMSILWSHSYDRNTADLLGVQEEVAEHVSRSLALELFPSATVGTRRYARSSAAYDAYLKGRFFWHKMSADTVRRAIFYFEEALTLDAGFAPALAGLADCYAQMGSFRVGQMKPIDAVAQANRYLRRAFDADETLAEAHCTRGLMKSWYELDWSGAERAFQIALALDPSLITALVWQSLLFQATGRHKESIASVQLAREIEPLSTSVNLYMGVAQANAGQHDLAVRQLQQCIELDPGFHRPYLFLGRSLAWLERYEEAIAAFEKARALTPDSIESLAWLASALAGKGERQKALELLKQVQATEERTEPSILVATIYARLGMATKMFACLERAVAMKSAPIYAAVISYEFNPYFIDPRYHRFLASIGLSHRAKT